VRVIVNSHLSQVYVCHASFVTLKINQSNARDQIRGAEMFKPKFSWKLWNFICIWLIQQQHVIPFVLLFLLWNPAPFIQRLLGPRVCQALPAEL